MAKSFTNNTVCIYIYRISNSLPSFPLLLAMVKEYYIIENEHTSINLEGDSNVR